MHRYRKALAAPEGRATFRHRAFLNRPLSVRLLIVIPRSILVAGALVASFAAAPALQSIPEWTLATDHVIGTRAASKSHLDRVDAITIDGSRRVIVTQAE